LKKIPNLLPCLFLAVSFPQANAQKISADYDKKADFKKYRTYAWLAPGDSVLNAYRQDKVYGGYITYAANKEIRSMGMKIDSVAPEAIFVFNTIVNSFETYTQSPTLSVGVAVRGPGYYAGGSAPVAGGKITAHSMEAGMIVYAMYDAQTGKLLWTGKGEKDFKMSQDIQKLIGDVTKRIFRKFPHK
jgi:hypothetical protein